jgi:DNA-binding NtrC family response regulator
VNVRIVAATNRDLREMIAEKQFREDLYYRLSMVEIRLPRLAERKEDLPLLARYFIDQFAAEYGKTIRGLTPRAEIVLARYPWPGNVRELRSTLGNACMMADGDLIDVQDLPDQLRNRSAKEPAAVDEVLPLEEMERQYVLRVLESVAGNSGGAPAKKSGDTPGCVQELLLLQCNAGVSPDFFAAPEEAVSLSESRRRSYLCLAGRLTLVGVPCSFL